MGKTKTYGADECCKLCGQFECRPSDVSGRSMAKPIKFEYDGVIADFEMIKVDRSRLYGFKELETHDENGKKCELTTLADDGKTLIGLGGTGVGYLTIDGNWVDKSELKAVDLEGNEKVPVPSSFAAPIKLEKEASIEEYLNHNFRLVYLLKATDVSEQLHQALIDQSIFKFDYSYRGGLEPDIGFLLMNEDRDIFFLVGEPTTIEFKGLQKMAAVAGEDSEGTGADDDMMDFGMI